MHRLNFSDQIGESVASIPKVGRLPLFLEQNFTDMARSLLFPLVFLVCLPLANAQFGTPTRQSEGLLYNRETAFTFGLHSNFGWQPGVEFGKIKTYYKTTLFQVNFSEIKDPKEYKETSGVAQNQTSETYIFGKQNNLFALRASWGRKHYFSEKARHRGVAVAMTYTVGPTLGLLKPYYLTLLYPTDNPSYGKAINQRYSDETAEVFTDKSRILGSAPFFTGFGEMGFLPGANATIALHLDWGAFDETIKAFEVGAMLDVFAKKAPILIGERNSQIFLNFFIAVQFGKRR